MTMAPHISLLRDVLPSEKLNKFAHLVPPYRASLRKISNGHNALTIFFAYVQFFAPLAIAFKLNNLIVYILAFLLVGRGYVLLNILGHEAAHKLLFSNRKVNDFVGKYVLANVAIMPFALYRLAHLTHHRDELGPEEPDLMLYSNYPITKKSFVRKLLRDFFLISGFVNLKTLFIGLKHRKFRSVSLQIIVTQLALWAMLSIFFPIWYYPLLVLLPWMSVWKVLNRLRAISEHGGMERSKDKRLTTHVVKQKPIARFWLVPYNTGYHLAHHVDITIPFRNLPKFHKELVKSGWVSPEITYNSYFELIKKLISK